MQIGKASASGAHEAQGCSKVDWFGVQTSVGTHHPAATPENVNSVPGNARPSSNDARSRGDARSEQEDERRGAGALEASHNHGGAPRFNRTRASRVGVKADSVRVRETREVSRAASAGEPIRSQGAWCVDVLLLNRGARSRSSTRESKAVGRRKAHGRSWRSGYGTVFVGARERQRHSEVGSISNGSSRRVRTRAARRGGSAPATRSSKVRSRRRHGESVRALFV